MMTRRYLLAAIWTCSLASLLRAGDPALEPPTTLTAIRPADRDFVERIEFGEPDDPVAGVARVEMVYLRGGRFLMGAVPGDTTAANDESPRHTVEVNPFWIARFELTWDAFYEYWQRRHRPKSRDEERAFAFPRPGQPWRNPIDDEDAREAAGSEVAAMGAFLEFPVRGVSQFGAQQFCRWLSIRTGRTYRLPTEAEWEYAARCGTNTRWSFGDRQADLARHAWFGDAVANAPHKPGGKLPNPWGLYDMYGNVGEWTLDGATRDYSRWAADKVWVDPWTRRDHDERGVTRGGSWADDADDTHSSSRNFRDDLNLGTDLFSDEWDLSRHGREIGIRLVCVPDERDRRINAVPRPSNLPAVEYR